MMKIITTSWDDGHPLDIKLAGVLKKHNIRGTFYIPQTNAGDPVLHKSEIQALAQDFEVGGHTYSHAPLPKLDGIVLRDEIKTGKKYIDDIVGRETRSFCLPMGLYNKRVIDEVINAGYSFARTTTLFQTRCGHPQLMHTTVQLYTHTRHTMIRHCLKRGMLQPFIDNAFFIKPCTITHLVKRYLSIIDADGGIFHLWGHSWEIEKYNLWAELEEVCSVLNKRNEFNKLTNGETWDHIHAYPK
ncbi:MAG: polysaccharide deacetylase family protein [Candidatus Omnitrophica bacterium]|nr:polysaccharide deacetylase family protein [Candidatus Omnitrophota bacterium]